MAGNASHHRAGSPDGSPDIGAVNRRRDRFGSRDAQQESSLSDTNSDRPLTIGEVAQEYGITLRTLRFYEAKRLLTPHRHGATRLYRSSDRKRLSVILTGRRLGFTLAEIKHLLNRPHDGGLHLTREQCVKQIKMLEQQKRSIETAITELRQIHTSFYQRLLEDAGEHSH
jgi:DNA-binding transcriptional MerR regulator